MADPRADGKRLLAEAPGKRLTFAQVKPILGAQRLTWTRAIAACKAAGGRMDGTFFVIPGTPGLPYGSRSASSAETAAPTTPSTKTASAPTAKPRTRRGSSRPTERTRFADGLEALDAAIAASATPTKVPPYWPPLEGEAYQDDEAVYGVVRELRSDSVVVRRAGGRLETLTREQWIALRLHRRVVPESAFG